MTQITAFEHYSFIFGPVTCSAGVNMFLIFLTWYKTISIKRHALRTGLSMPLTTLLIKDGTIFFSFIVIDILLNFAIQGDELAKDMMIMAWSYFSPTLKATILTRFMLNLRSILFSDGNGPPSRWDNSQISSSIVFRALPTITSSRVVGNLGTTVQIGDEDQDGWEDEVEENVGTSTGICSGEDRADMHTRSRAAVHYSDDPFRTGMLDE
ncbi:hypothetical protein C8Q74DRAFT_1444134 [Fomes fomentarius]|nr:hypothetical protein C8Q74DRAFT_1444134 [Fomes fomentarius]